MVSENVPYVSPEEYLAMELVSEAKHEYYAGEVVAMAGASEEHNYIFTNLMSEIGYFLKEKTCKLFGADFRVNSHLSESYFYPDLVIVCGDLEKKKDVFHTLMNPTVIIEIMSASTMDHDLGYKFWQYLQIPSVKEYILVDSTSLHVKSIVKQEDGSFKISYLETIEASLKILSIGLDISMTDIYRNVTFEPA